MTIIKEVVAPIKPTVYTIILASGTGNRFGSQIPKQFTRLDGLTILDRSISTFDAHPDIDKIIVVADPVHLRKIQADMQKQNYNKIAGTIPGGKTRQQSAANGVYFVAEKDLESWVLIHDAARPLVSAKIISDCVVALKSASAVNVAIPVTDTIVAVNGDKIIQDIPLRSNLMQVQTPQAFHTKLILAAHKLAKGKNIKGATDDCGLIFQLKLAPVTAVTGDVTNIKITYPLDLIIGQSILDQK